jgi:hypothetical protein
MIAIKDEILTQWKEVGHKAHKNNLRPEKVLYKKHVVEWLWKCKEKSRASFLIIFSFIDITAIEMENIFIVLKPNGSGFYAQYVRDSIQFKYTKEN